MPSQQVDLLSDVMPVLAVTDISNVNTLTFSFNSVKIRFDLYSKLSILQVFVCYTMEGNFVIILTDK